MAKTPATVPATEPEHVESAMDYAEHERTYNGFLVATKWGIISTVVLMVILYFVINP